MKPSSAWYTALAVASLSSLASSGSAFLISPSKSISPVPSVDPRRQSQQERRFVWSSTPKDLMTPLRSSSASSQPWPEEGGGENISDVSSPLLPSIGSEMGEQQRQERSSSSSVDSKLTLIFRGLFGFYTSAGLIMSVLVAAGNLPAAYAQTIVTTMWMSFVLSISGMEAWVKFRAPFCPRPFKLDIGRTIFRALNAVEGAFCTTLWMLHISAVRVLGNTTGLVPLILLTGILLLDMFFLTPKLDRHGEKIVKDYMDSENASSTATTAIMSNTESSNQATSTLSSKFEKYLHVIYVLLELFKIIGLVTCLRMWFPVYVLHGIAPFPQ